ncbi:hypothetical protein ACH5RR_023050 [Cinchona calisaya]|uniref:Uncharacterized protein n=1 Tax=Cinchona calisaya TaxID=153742 RepID=A0ABD2Z9L6_9GENT
MEIQANQEEVAISRPPYVHLISAFLAMEPPNVLISFARECGGGFIGEEVQSFIWNHYINKTDDRFPEGNSRVVKRISFLFPDDAFVLSHQKLRILDSVYKASDTNIYEGFYLMQVVLSDGDLSTLSNMRLNLESNLLSTRSDVPEHDKDPSTQIFIFLSAILRIHNEMLFLSQCSSSITAGYKDKGRQVPENLIVFKNFLVSVAILTRFFLPVVGGQGQGNSTGLHPVSGPCKVDLLLHFSLVLFSPFIAKSEVQNEDSKFDSTKEVESCSASCVEHKGHAFERGPVAYIASVIRNMETFDYFLELVKQADLIVNNITENSLPFNLLCYAKPHQRSSIRNFSISYM